MSFGGCGRWHRGHRARQVCARVNHSGSVICAALVVKGRRCRRMPKPLGCRSVRCLRRLPTLQAPGRRDRAVGLGTDVGAAVHNRAAVAAFRVPLANGVVVEVASHGESATCAAVLECASRLPCSERGKQASRCGGASSRSSSQHRAPDSPAWSRPPWRWTRSRRSSWCSPIAGAAHARFCPGSGADWCCGKSAWSGRALLGSSPSGDLRDCAGALHTDGTSGYAPGVRVAAGAPAMWVARPARLRRDAE